MRRIPSFLALRAFEAGGRLGSFAQAADELHLTPSAISHQVRALEAYFGQPLFVRRSRHVDLTAGGRLLLDGLSQAFDAIETACAEVVRTPSTTGLAVHCAPSFASKWLGPKLPDFLRRHPEINLRLTASADPIDLGRREDIDLVIAYGTVPARRGITAEPLGIEQVTALAAPHVADRIDLDRSDWLHGLALIESAVNPVLWDEWCAANGLPPPGSGSRPSFDRGALAVSAAVQGLGAVLETTRFAAEELERGQLVPLRGDCLRSIPRVLHFLCSRDRQRGLDKIAVFRAWLLDITSSDVTCVGS